MKINWYWFPTIITTSIMLNKHFEDWTGIFYVLFLFFFSYMTFGFNIEDLK